MAMDGVVRNITYNTAAGTFMTAGDSWSISTLVQEKAGFSPGLTDNALYSMAQMQQHVKEFRHLRVNVQQVLRDGQMSGAGNGQKLRHALHQAQQEGRKSVHISYSPVFSDYILFISVGLFRSVFVQKIRIHLYYSTLRGKLPV